MRATALDTYIDGLLAGMTDDDLEFLFTSGVLDFPAYDALYFGTSTDPAYALPAEYGKELSHAFRNAQRFWDIPSADIQLLAMHGDMLLNQGQARATHRGLRVEPRGGRNLRVASRGQDAGPGLGRRRQSDLHAQRLRLHRRGARPHVASLPDKLVFGDGVLDALEWLGLADVGPRAILAHEFGHHVQFENHVFDNQAPTPEATRRTELMADALGTYLARTAEAWRSTPSGSCRLSTRSMSLGIAPLTIPAITAPPTSDCAPPPGE